MTSQGRNCFDHRVPSAVMQTNKPCLFIWFPVSGNFPLMYTPPSPPYTSITVYLHSDRLLGKVGVRLFGHLLRQNFELNVRWVVLNFRQWSHEHRVQAVSGQTVRSKNKNHNLVWSVKALENGGLGLIGLSPHPKPNQNPVHKQALNRTWVGRVEYLDQEPYLFVFFQWETIKNMK